MNEFTIRGPKGAYKDFFREFHDHDLRKRINYRVSIIKDTFDQIVTFVPNEGYKSISPEDLNELKKLLSNSCKEK